MKIGFYPMVADVLHAGHILAIKEAKEYCDYLIIGLHCNPNYKQPIQSIFERHTQLKAIKWVNEIIPYNDINDVRLVMKSISFDIYFLGEDYLNKEFEASDLVRKLGKEVHYISRKHDMSSTNLKKRLMEN